MTEETISLALHDEDHIKRLSYHVLYVMVLVTRAGVKGSDEDWQ